MNSQYIIEYLNDVSLYLDTIRVGIETNQDVGSLLNAVSDTFLRISQILVLSPGLSRPTQ